MCLGHAESSCPGLRDGACAFQARKIVAFEVPVCPGTSSGHPIRVIDQGVGRIRASLPRISNTRCRLVAIATHPFPPTIGSPVGSRPQTHLVFSVNVNVHNGTFPGSAIVLDVVVCASFHGSSSSPCCAFNRGGRPRKWFGTERRRMLRFRHSFVPAKLRASHFPPCGGAGGKLSRRLEGPTRHSPDCS